MYNRKQLSDEECMEQSRNENNIVDFIYNLNSDNKFIMC